MQAIVSVLPSWHHGVLKALTDPVWEYRTAGGIAKDTGIWVAAVDWMLNDTPFRDHIHGPLLAVDGTGRQFYTLKPNTTYNENGLLITLWNK